jgi:hypothetical protein
MDLSTGSREFMDIEGDEAEDEAYKAMNWKQKAKYQLSNW